LIFKKKNNGCKSDRKNIHCIVVDTDVPGRYPVNFICVLPLKKGLLYDQPSRFSEIFGGKRVEIAKQLLSNSLRIEHDVEIRTEIKRRLSLLRKQG